ncbi:hypothetical protein ABH926_001995 [Catenulispora sp. GP43]|uniref:hypothetical protein n=1 Tax=Catenulispora sp. GP43 TaxID=3156263 RepID=UPI00351167DC
MKRLAKSMILAGAVAAAFATSMQAASAESELWYSYPGFQSTWHCNTTGTFALNSGEGYAYIQACEVWNGSYYQGLVNVSFSQAHSDASINVTNATSRLPENGVRTCYGAIGSGERSCFAHTEYPLSSAGEAQAHVTNLFVDGVGYSLNSPISGPDQEWSPWVP